jgi:hypothetical protein
LSANEIDFGQVRVGELVIKSVILRNGGGAPLLLTNVKSSCPCGVAQLSSRRLLPGATEPLVILLRPAQPGRKQQQVILTTNDPTNETILLNISSNASVSSDGTRGSILGSKTPAEGKAQ